MTESGGGSGGGADESLVTRRHYYRDEHITSFLCGDLCKPKLSPPILLRLCLSDGWSMKALVSAG